MFLCGLRVVLRASKRIPVFCLCTACITASLLFLALSESRSPRGEGRTPAFLCPHPVLNSKNAGPISFFACSCAPPSGGPGKGQLRAEFYPGAPRDQSLRSQSLSRKVIKRSVTTTQCMEPMRSFLLLNKFICGVFLCVFEKVLAKALH